MTSFKDGPAQGKCLMLSRSPFFLRVVKDGREIDALDKLEDVAKPNEEIFLYYRISIADCAVFIDGRKNGKRWSWNGRPATYALWQEFPEPDDATLRDNERFKAWCLLVAQKKASLDAANPKP